MSQWWESKNEEHTIWTELKTDDGLTYFFNTQTGETSWDCPDELMTESDRAKQGDWVWLPDEENCYIPGKVTARQGGQITVETDTGQRYNYSANDNLEPLRWAWLQRITPDLVLLDNMSNGLILHNLRKRFEGGHIYTNIGTILISINPYRQLEPDIYTNKVIDDYRTKLENHKDMPPHVYVIGDNAFKGLSFDSGLNQSVIISGESGAGKTEAAKQCVSYLAAVAGSVSGIERKLFVSNPILESFGNAKTVRNNNSSRFGKYMEIMFNRELNIYAAQTTNYLLEKIRVPNPSPGERNFHIFYQLCQGGGEMAQKFNVGEAQFYHYLNRSQCTTVDGINDQSDFQDTTSAMNEMGFSIQEIDDTFQIVAGILHLGNVTTRARSQGVEITDMNALQNAAYFLGLEDAALQGKLTYRTVRIRGQPDIDVPLKPAEATDARDALSKFVYEKLFDWIVERVNKAMAQSEFAYKSIGILDIFGFEIFELNSFEQLCINYTNEKLQQHFNAHTFKMEEQLYKDEGIPFVHVPFIDNEPILKLIEDKPWGLLNLVDEEVRIPEGSDRGYLSKITESQKESQYFSVDARLRGQSFLLLHYAGQVAYDVTGFVEKNADTLTLDLLELVMGSAHGLLMNLFVKGGSDANDARRRKATLATQFKTQLNQLMKTLNKTEPHYIRCVKPNEDKAPLYFVAKMCEEQLTYSGVFEAVKIRKSGYPFRLRHADFVIRYACLLGNENMPKNVQGCKQIIHQMGFDPENVKMGGTMVLYRAEEHRKLELDRSIIKEQEGLSDWLADLVRKGQSGGELPESYYEELSKAVARANQFNLNSTMADRARALLEAFIEARIDPETKQLLQAAFDSRDIENLRYGCEVADQYGYRTRLCRNCKKLLQHLERINEEAIKARDTLEDKPMEVCLNAADLAGWTSEDIEVFRTMFSMSAQQYYQEQMRAAVRLKDTKRQIRLSIALKEEFLKTCEHLFVLAKYNKIKSPDDWASEKFIKLSSDKLRAGMLKWTKDSIHSSLSELPEGKQNKQTRKDAESIFKELQVYIGDRKPSKKQAFNKNVGLNVLSRVLANQLLHAEFYIQIMKQLTANPNQGSVRKCWEIMILALNSFPPGTDFENYLQVFLKNSNCPDKDRFITALHTMAFSSARSVPTPAEFDSITSGKDIRHPEFTDKAPPAAPSWQDILGTWEEREEEEEMLFTSTHKRPGQTIAYRPKNTTGAKAFEAPREAQEIAWGAHPTLEQGPTMQVMEQYEGPWVECIDPDSGYPYYENEETGETTWDKPAEMP